MSQQRVMRCDKLGDKIKARHDLLVLAWCRILRRAGFACSVEPALHRLLCEGARMRQLGARGDVMAVLQAVMALDVSVIHPAAPSHARRASCVDGAAATERDDFKRRKYAGNGCAEAFIPLSVETYGRLGKPAIRLVRTLAAAASVGGLLSRSAFCAAAYTELSVALVKGQERVFRMFAFNLAVEGAQFAPGDLVPSV